jgi:hypothetical protein
MGHPVGFFAEGELPGATAGESSLDGSFPGGHADTTGRIVVGERRGFKGLVL